MSKVVITKEQAELVETVKKNNHHEKVLKRVLLGEEIPNRRFWPLSELSFSDLLSVFIDGYEIEKPKFEVGDWVVKGKQIQQIKYWQESCAVGQNLFYETDKNAVVYINEIRHATKEEIFWAELGREVGEFRDDDLLIDNENRFWVVDTSNSTAVSSKGLYLAGKLKGFYPSESFKSFLKGDES